MTTRIGKLNRNSTATKMLLFTFYEVFVGFDILLRWWNSRSYFGVSCFGFLEFALVVAIPVNYVRTCIV